MRYEVKKHVVRFQNKVLCASKFFVAQYCRPEFFSDEYLSSVNAAYQKWATWSVFRSCTTWGLKGPHSINDLKFLAIENKSKINAP